jgi:predicted TIM-barrel fold metal-dependent hydrolase
MTDVTTAQAPRSTAQRYRIIDADSHFVEPQQMWLDYLPSRYHDVAPRTVIDNEGYARLCVAGRTFPLITKKSKPEIASKMAEPGGYDPKPRLAMMDREDIEAMVMYPSTALMFAAIDQLDVLVALCQAYNNWARDYCSVAPSRLLAPALVPQTDVLETMAETRRAVANGAAGIFLRPNPVHGALDDPAWEPLWSCLEDLDVPLGIHEGSGFPGPQFGADRSDNFLYQHMISHPFEHMVALLHLICGGVLDRHPNLRVLFLEAGCGWLPFWLERMEHHHDEWGFLSVPLSMRPTEFFKRQCFVSADIEETAAFAATVACLGADNLCWSTDYPHPDHEWDGMAKGFLARTDITDGQKLQIVGGNAVRAYKLPDPEERSTQ